MIGFDAAIALLAGAGRPVGRERVPLAAAHGRVLAEAVLARADSPAADTSSMDGYAVREADVVAPARLRVVGESFAGRGFAGALSPGDCVRIFTGAPIPSGADRVVVQEIVRRDADAAILDQAPGGARHLRPRGSDFRRGDALLQPGRRLDPRAMVAAAAADAAEVEVWRRPRLMVLATGDELAEPGDAAARAGAIPESVSFGVAGLAADQGAEVIDRLRLPDDPATLERAAADALDRSDVVVVAGGASVGEKDYARAMFGPAGLSLIFSRLAIRPGKPVWLGRARDRLVLGLPGNPTSAMVTARLFLAPLLAGATGRTPATALDWRPVLLAGALPPCDERETFHRATWTEADAVPVGNQDSSAQRALAAADLLIRRRAGAPAAAAGDRVDALAF